MRALRLVVLDATDTGGITAAAQADGTSRRTIGLSPAWLAGARLYDVRGVIDGWFAARTWSEALGFAASEAARTGRPVGSLQAWGHGGFGFMRIADGALDKAALAPNSKLAGALDSVRDALTSDAIVWLRCCSAFGHETGRSFARAFADRLRVRVAGHTHIIGFWQSGAHSLAPGASPGWDEREGVRFEGGKVTGALGSSMFAPNTITCLRSELPKTY